MELALENSIPSIIIALISLISIAGIIYPFPPFKKRWRALLTLVACSVAFSIVSPQTETVSDEPEQTASAPLQRVVPDVDLADKFWVTSERLYRRTCPSTECGEVGYFFFREGVDVLERRDGWARVTKYYNASCTNGRSEHVDSGNSQCTPENGIADGEFAEWVSAEFLSETRPPDPAEGARGTEALIARSDDFARYRTQFAEAAQSLLDEGRCKGADFRENGGWLKSSTHRNQPIYFVYCGGLTKANRLYLNVETGRVFQ